MKRLTICALCGIIIACLQVIAFADEEKLEQKTTVSGFGYFMFGQIVKGTVGIGIPDPATPSGRNLRHYWQESADVDLYLTSKPNNWFTTKAGLSVIKSFPLQYGSMDRSSFYTSFAFSVPMAEGIFHWKFNDNAISSLMLEAGFFQYLFNPDVKNLGNFMYRSTVLPLSIQTRIDYPWADLMGMRTEVGLLDNTVKLEAILRSEIFQLPWYDWDLGFAGSYTTPNKVFDIGGAVCFNRLISVGHNPVMPDTVVDKMKDLKVAARFTFDPKPLLKPLFGGLFDEDALIGFGPEDFKIYGEAAVLGQKDSALYTYIPKPIYWRGMPIRRMPLLLGVNFPGFKVLDVISIEVEWFKSPYPNDWCGQLQYSDPYPRDFSPPWEVDNYVNRDNIKWSVYLKKKIANFEIRGMAASDHTIYKAFNLENMPSFEQTMKEHGDWHWFFEFRFNL